MNIDQAKQLEVGDLITNGPKEEREPPYVDCCRIVKLHLDGYESEHCYISQQKEIFGRLIPNGHRSKTLFTEIENNQDYYKNIHRIGSNKTGL
jgi:hypothetical protein